MGDGLAFRGGIGLLLVRVNCFVGWPRRAVGLQSRSVCVSLQSILYKYYKWQYKNEARSAFCGLSPHIIEIPDHLNLHKLKQLFLTLIIEIMIKTELIDNLSNFLLIPRVELDLVHLLAHVDIDYQEGLVVVGWACEFGDFGGLAEGLGVCEGVRACVVGWVELG